MRAKNIATSIADGIKSAIGKVTGAISDVTQSVRDFLPFSPAKQGPLKDLHKLDFGIIADGIYKAKKPVARAMADLTGTALYDSVAIAMPTISNPNAKMMEGVVNGLASIIPQTNNGPIQIKVVLQSGKELAEVVFDPLTGIAKQKGVPSFG